MARHTDDQIEQAERSTVPHDEITTAAIHRLSHRVIELEGVNTALLNALTRYRANEDQMLRPEERPCRCEMCRQADEAIEAAKGKQ